MLIRVDASSAQPLYGQIAAQVRMAILDGELSGADRLPSAKDLAKAVAVNVHTVLRAYAELRDEGLIELRPRREAVVVVQSMTKRADLLEEVRGLVHQARRQGLTRAEILDVFTGEP